jgi:restriction endonuclease S subunit
MGKDKKTPVTIDGVEYQYEDLTQEQQMMVNHLLDLDRKIASSQFNLDQLSVGKQAFMNMLKASLEPKDESKAE